MNKVVTTLLVVVFGVIGSTAAVQPHFSTNKEPVPLDSRNQASVFFTDTVTEDSLRLAYAKASSNKRTSSENKIKVLIVPGHDPVSYGTEFLGLREYDLNLDLSKKIYDFFAQESIFDVRLAQTSEGFDPELEYYFERNMDETREFVEGQKLLMNHFISTGLIEPHIGVIHNTAPQDVALRLYAINKWANENDIDIVLHVHFNDYPGRNKRAAGEYDGFSIYVPESQYSNSKGSKAVAESIFEKLNEAYPQSDFPREAAGIVEDQELIAVGAYNTLDAVGLLIEYGYIYEPMVAEPSLRDAVLTDLAFRTYRGVATFFNEGSNKNDLNTTLLPHEWSTDLEVGAEGNLDVLKLQMALILEGVYPPEGKTKNDCSLTGLFGPCTAGAVRAFQEKYGITPAAGVVGEQTRAKLNELY